MSHIVGYSAILIVSLTFGCTAQLVPLYDPAALVTAIADNGISLLFGVPATYQRLLEYKTVTGIAKLPRGKLRSLSVAGAPLHLTLKSAVEPNSACRCSTPTALPNALLEFRACGRRPL